LGFGKWFGEKEGGRADTIFLVTNGLLTMR
jgi:hypothetical protein